MKFVRGAVLTGCFFFCVAGSALAQSLVFAVHPFLSALELHERFQPLVDLLARQTGHQIVLRIENDYATHIENLCRGRTDIAFMGPAGYVEASSRCQGLQPLGVLTGAYPYLRGALVVRRDSSLEEIAELKGHSVAFVSRELTMGYQLPFYVLHQAGLCLGDLSRYDFLNNHENVAVSVLAGRFDAGAVKYETYENLRDGLRILGLMPEVADHPFVASAGLPQAVFDELKGLLLHLHESEAGRAILHGLRFDAVQIHPVDDADYNSLRACAKCLQEQEVVSQ
ncbi:MAG: PhnD/SsuA/transferrin family substrate-binding protein [Desulfuromonadaceae bacterium]|nr:PhnD/SsuA/transferrin family substrate-binding protein [Desulfuromonadaceae bacterium]